MWLANMSKTSTLLLILILAASSIIMVENGAAATKPSVPEFTVSYINRSYDVPATTSIDSYTGKTVTNPAHHVINYTIQFTMKNQTYDSSLDLYYNIRVKPHFGEENWTTLYGREYSPRVTDSDLTLVFSCTSDNGVYRNFYRDWAEIHAPQGGQIDIQVEAFHAGEDYFKSPSNPMGSWVWVIRVESGWSPTQTITIGSSPSTVIPTTQPSQSTPTISATQTQNPTAASPEQPIEGLFGFSLERIALIVMAVAIAVLAAAVAVLWRKVTSKGNGE